MGVIEDIYDDLDVDEPSLEEFREAVAAKVEQMGGLADEETAAMLLAHEITGGEVEGIADVEPGMDEAKFVAQVTGIGELRTFEREEGDEEEPGRVVNVEVADETGSIRAAFWDDHAAAAIEELEVGDTLRIKGRPKDGYRGVEVSVTDVEPDDDVDLDVAIQDRYRVEDLTLGRSDVTLAGRVLDTDSVRTFDRNDGSTGKVANLTLGDGTGRVRVTLWDDRAALAESFEPGESVEVVDGYVKERDGSLELHVGDRGAVEAIDEEITYTPESTPIEALELDETTDIAGVIRSADPKRSFDRDDGSEGQVRNVRVQDDTGDIRVALWGEKADYDLQPGDEVAFADVEIQDGWQDDLEASAGWQSTVTVLEDGGSPEPQNGGAADLSSFADGGGGEGGGSAGAGGASVAFAEESTADRDGERIEFTGAVVQQGDPVVLDDGEETLRVETAERVHLGEEITVRGRMVDGRLDADEVL